MKKIHTDVVRDSLAALEKFKLTDTVPVDINPEEIGISRKLRVDLARLRSGWHPKLENYLHRIGRLRTPQCRRCHTGTGDVQHFLLHCPILTTYRQANNIQSLEDLWTKPVEAGRYIHEADL